MKALTIFCLALVILASRSLAAPVGREKASLVANTFVNGEKARWQQRPEITPVRFGAKMAAAAAQAYAIKGVTEIKGEDGITTAYVAELEPEGFVIISADDEVEPVLGFSFQGQFPFAESGHNAMLHLVKWDTAGRMKMLKEAKAKGIATKLTNQATQKWEYYSKTNSGVAQPLTPTPLTPDPLTLQQWPSNQDGWLTTMWNQNSPFDDDCPNYYFLGLPIGRCDVGCVATAMAQIINYWKYPSSASFLPSDDYINKGYAPIRFDADSSGYGFPTFSQLNSLLSTITYNPTDNAEQAALCFGIGIKLKMNYGVPLSIGNVFTGGNLESATSLSDAAYKNGFSYDSAILRGGLNVWNSYIGNVIANMKSGWPVQIGIFTTDQKNGHSVVLDGYRSDGAFHVNLGWGTVNGITPAGTWYYLPSMNTVSYGDLDYELIQQIVYDIAPYQGWSQVGADALNSYRTIYSGPTAAINKWSVTDSAMPSGSTINGLTVGTGNQIFAVVNPTVSSGYPDIFMSDQFGTKNRIGLSDKGYTLTSPAMTTNGIVCTIGAYNWSSSYPNVYLYEINPQTLQYTKTTLMSIAQDNFGDLKIDSQNYLYVADINHLYCFSPSGSFYWPAFTFPHSAQLINDIKAPCVDVSRNKIYVTYYSVGSSTAYLGCINRTTGQLITEVSFSSVPINRISVPSIGPDGTVYVGVNTTLYALNPDNNLATKWSINPSGGAGYILEPPAIGADGTLYMAYWTAANTIAFSAFNSSTGAKNWEQDVTPSGDYDIGSRGYVTQGGTVYFWRYVHNGTSQLYAYQDNGTSATPLFNQAYAGASIGGFGPGGTMYVTSGTTINAVAGGTVGDPEGAGMGFADNQPPNQPTLVTPADGTTGVSSNSVTLSWQCSDPVGHGLSYNLSVCALITNQEAVFAPITNGLAATSFTLTNLSPGVTYLWKVVASDGQAITESPVSAFIVQTNSMAGTNTVYLLQSPFNPQVQDVVLASGSGIHNLEGGAQLAEVFNGKIYYAIRSDGSSSPSKIYCFDPANSNNVAVLNATSDYFWALKAMNGALWVSHINGNLWESTDGVNFTPIAGTPFATTNYVTAMAVFNGQMYFATSVGNIYASPDGSTFNLMTTIDPGYYIKALTVWNGYLYGANVGQYGLPGGYSPLPDLPSLIFRTANGTAWTMVNTNNTFEFEGFVPTANYLYLASTEDPNGASLAFRSTTDGTNWPTRFFYTTSEGKAITGHPMYFSQTGVAYFLSNWNGVVKLFPIFNGVMESRIQTAHAFNSVVEVDGQLFGIGSQSSSDVQSSPFVVSRLGSYTNVLGSAFDTPIKVGAGTFHLNLLGQNGSAYIIQASTNLLDWPPIYTNSATGGFIQFDDTGMTNFSRRFYRAVMQ